MQASHHTDCPGPGEASRLSQGHAVTPVRRGSPQRAPAIDAELLTHAVASAIALRLALAEVDHAIPDLQERRAMRLHLVNAQQWVHHALQRLASRADAGAIVQQFGNDDIGAVCAALRNLPDEGVEATSFG